jgi:betaine-aldehyde dehydrogenase
VDRPLRIARELQAGTVWINDWLVVRDDQPGVAGRIDR